jgi:hypothetical protein
MTTSTDNRFAFDDFRTEFSFEGLPPFPDLDSATENGRSGGGDTAPENDSNDNNDTEADGGTGAAAPDGDTPAGRSGDAGDTDDRDDTGPGSLPGSGDGTGDGTVDADDKANDEDDAPAPTTSAPTTSASTTSASTTSAPTTSASTTSASDDLDGLRQGYLPQRALTLLPSALTEPARWIGDRRKRDVFITGALPMWASALPNVRFRYGGSGVSPNLYSAVVAPPASGKSALRHARKFGAPLREELGAGGPALEPPAAGEAPEDEAPEDNAPSGEQSGERGSLPKHLFLAADSSAAALKEQLAENPHGVIFETEFRTLSQALESSWGTFTDVLLKGFQNETIKMSRSSKGTVTISHPAPSIALAGTPVTFNGVISGTSDGLFSRFLFYRFDREFEWTAQFGDGGSGLEQHLQGAAENFRAGYRQLQAREEPLWVRVPEALQSAHNRAFRSLTEKWRRDERVSRSLQASLTRAGLQAVKIAVVLRGIRLTASGVPSAPPPSVELTANDMEAGLRLALTYLLHAVRVETRFQEESGARADLTGRKRKYLEALPDGKFSTAEAKGLASRFSVSERNVQRWLKNWREAGLLTKPKRGTWAKLSPELEGIAGVESVISVIDDIPAL